MVVITDPFLHKDRMFKDKDSYCKEKTASVDFKMFG